MKIIMNYKFALDSYAWIEYAIGSQMGEFINFIIKYTTCITPSIVIAELSDKIAVMYLGKIVEIGDKKEVLSNPMHPYTRALISAIPIPDPKRKMEEIPIKGTVPNPIDLPKGCRFRPRCPFAKKECEISEPNLIRVKKNHWVACHLIANN